MEEESTEGGMIEEERTENSEEQHDEPTAEQGRLSRPKCKTQLAWLFLCCRI